MLRLYFPFVLVECKRRYFPFDMMNAVPLFLLLLGAYNFSYFPFVFVKCNAFVSRSLFEYNLSISSSFLFKVTPLFLVRFIEYGIYFPLLLLNITSLISRSFLLNVTHLFQVRFDECYASISP